MALVDEIINDVIADSKIWDLPLIYRIEIIELAKKLKVPPRREAVKNFVAAYLVVRGLMSPSTADRVVASSTKGRLLWQDRLRRVLSSTNVGAQL